MGGGCEETADVDGQGNCVHLDSKDARIVRPKGEVILLRKAQNVFVIDHLVRNDATSRKPCFQECAFQVKDRPYDPRGAGLVREFKVAEFDLGGVEDAQEREQNQTTCRGRA